MLTALHERRLVRYLNRLGDVNEQLCYVRYIGRRHVVLYNYSRDLKIPRDRILRITTPSGQVEYQKKP